MTINTQNFDAINKTIGQAMLIKAKALRQVKQYADAEEDTDTRNYIMAYHGLLVGQHNALLWIEVNKDAPTDADEAAQYWLNWVYAGAGFTPITIRAWLQGK